ncbi:hypothetical protein C8R46DRAFT_288054 [Mycena filopes]|nr:hypothetical protein C8R46DRAFT_288054 [Mycena filopes]
MASSHGSDPDMGVPASDKPRAEQDKEEDPIPYPVLTLPNEIVSEIFTHSLPPYPECPPWTGSLSPSLLTQICKKWRDIALSTPELWRALAFTLSPPPPLPQLEARAASPAQIDTSRLQLWLDRSGACPLSLQIVSHRYHDPRVSQFLDAALPHHARWEHLTLHCGAVSPLLRLDVPMPRLRHLDVDVDVDDPVPILQDAPLLSTVVLNYGATMALVLPWVQLTKLVLCQVYPSNCSIVLQQTPNLVCCEIPSLWLDEVSDTAEPDVHLPHLESLIFGDESDTVTNYHGTFIVPALRRLHIPELFLGLNPIDSLRCFLLKSGCQPREVRITGPLEVDRHEYYAAFPSIPSICFDEVETSK